MREILFRGKRDKKYNKEQEWAYGAPYIDHEGDYIIATDYSKRVVIPETVGQYTGLTDKNGTKIFEDDIAKNIDGAFLVCWEKEKCAFVMRFLEYPYETLYLEEMWEDSEVIGNIHDNPELLGESE